MEHQGAFDELKSVEGLGEYMICPSCTSIQADTQRFCGRCRMSFSKKSLLLSKLRDHLYWIFRRANAGFSSGFVAWLFIPALSRVISFETSPLLHFAVQGFLGGAFLGTVDGMIDESNSKTVRGGLIGGFGGLLGGALFGYFSDQLTPEQTAWGLFLFWAIAGAAIGIVSALWERQKKKLFFGALSGFVGGGIGGALGYAVYAYMVQEFSPETWFMRRICEGFSGGIIGICLWFSIGIAERFIIFKRRPVTSKNKNCDHCQAVNPLNTWYCTVCGSVLQEAALPQDLNLPTYKTLERLQATYKFLSRLSSTTGDIAGLVVFVVFLPVHKLLAFVAFVLVVAASYCLLLLFSSVSESLQVFIRK